MSVSMGTNVVRVMPTGKHTGTVIFLHGSGDTGQGVREWIKTLLGKDLTFPNLKLLYPTAPLRPYTPLDGHNSYVWFDRQRISPDVPEHLETINSSAEQLSQLVRNEINDGILLRNIVIGGFSMGGAMAMHLGYRSLFGIGGVFALSSFLNDNSIVYKELSNQVGDGHVPPLFMCHGDRDELVYLSWGQQTFELLKKNGVEGQFHILKDAFHELKKRELRLLNDWLLERVPIAS
ncbi:hypothetical protein R5R35_011271 [Gryllus longicercus]|uniref:palmitoyl-protein hydrolase n=1 Tax=Gryllus longicercus TaxID=2509291 RepID=A0AAN9VGD8_9ORTH